MDNIRPSPLAGRWYPADTRRLVESIDGYIQAAEVPEIPEPILALVSPHAGHQFSGPVAGYAFKSILGMELDLVIILSPYHQHHTDAILSSGHVAYSTPLGNVPVDAEAQAAFDQKLFEKAGLQLARIRNDQEHAVEILLPFFQRSLTSDFKVLPLMLRRQDQELMNVVGEILAEMIEIEGILLAASTDLSHFHPVEKAQQLDQRIIEGIRTLDPEKLYQAEASGAGSACGLGALAAVIQAVQSAGKARARILNYAHSGEITGDHSSVVGYTSAVLTRE